MNDPLTIRRSTARHAMLPSRPTMTTTLRSILLALGLIATAGCGGAQTTTTETNEPEPAQSGSALTAAQCAEAGGQVVGDIGDGAIHRPDYRCASGEPPLGPIASEPGQPVAIEGAVCCR
jgi:hypothetical protein